MSFVIRSFTIITVYLRISSVKLLDYDELLTAISPRSSASEYILNVVCMCFCMAQRVTAKHENLSFVVSMQKYWVWMSAINEKSANKHTHTNKQKFCCHIKFVSCYFCHMQGVRQPQAKRLSNSEIRWWISRWFTACKYQIALNVCMSAYHRQCSEGFIYYYSHFDSSLIHYAMHCILRFGALTMFNFKSQPREQSTMQWITTIQSDY